MTDKDLNRAAAERGFTKPAHRAAFKDGYAAAKAGRKREPTDKARDAGLSEAWLAGFDLFAAAQPALGEHTITHDGRDVSPRVRSRVPGLAHPGPIISDGLYARCPVVTLCSATGQVVVEPDLYEARGAEARANVVHRAPWWRRLIGGAR